MSDDEKKQPPQEQPKSVPTFPPYYAFPEELLKRWIALPTETQFTITLTRGDIDNLLFGLLRGGDAHLATEEAIVRWSNGDVDGANESIAVMRMSVIERQNRIRLFFTAVMKNAMRDSPNEG